MLRPVGGAGLDAKTWATTRRLAKWLEQVLGSGRPLDDAVRQQMESLFGRNLEDVRIHDSHHAGELARRLGGQAFTIGGQIFGDEGDFSTLTPEGMGLMAHELTHVIQQTQPAPAHHGGMAPCQSAFTRGASVSHDAQGPMFAGHTPPSPGSIHESIETEAMASEEAVQQAVERRQRTPQGADVEKLADMVYRLMQQELRMDRERNVRTR